MPDYPALDRLQRALNPLPGAAVDGAHQMSITGTVNILGGGSGGTSMTDNQPFTPGSTSVTPMAGYFGGRSVSSGNAAAVSIDHSGNLQVNVVAGGAGGGVANITVRGSGNQDIHVGYVGGGSVNSDGGAYMPILGTVNLGVGAAPFASVAVYGSPANPVYVIGSENVVGGGGSMGVTQIGAPWVVVGSVNVTGSINPVGVFGSLGALVGSVNITGSINPVGVFGSLGALVGSVNITGSINPVGVFGSVNALASLPGVTTNGSLALDVDPRGNLTATSWIISMAASSQTQIAATAPANQRIYLTSFHLTCDGTAYMQWMSPSGVALSGSMQLLPGAGFALAGAFPNGPVVIGSQQSGLYIRSVGTINIGGFAVGYVGT